MKYTGSTTITSVTDVTTETLTVTGTKGKRSGTTGTTITQTVTLDATLYKDAEFAISGNKSVIDNRTYLDAPTEHSFTLTKKKNVTYIDLIAEDTVDEKIVRSLRKKINIASEVMGEELRDWI